jgi:hypothetical protein
MKPGEGDRIVSITVFVDDRPAPIEGDAETEA